MRVALTLATLGLVACTGDDGKDDNTGVGSDVSWSEDVHPYLAGSCGVAGCHGAPTVNGMEIDADPAVAYAALVDADSEFATGEVLVIPSDSDGSYVVMKLEGASGITGDPMPPPFGGEDPADIQMVRDWIDAGAPEN